MRKLLVICFFIFCTHSLLYPNSILRLKERIEKAHVGDYVVTSQSNTYSILIIRSLQPPHLLLEEITTFNAPTKLNWKQWVNKGAPGNTSWLLYEIDLEKSALIQCYSHTRKSWIYPDNSDHFFSKLLSLTFQPLAEAERKRIGPAPLSGEPDVRKIWSPPVFVEGKKMNAASIQGWKTRWPNDGSSLSQSTIEVYMDSNRPAFPFPCWLEIKGGHYTFKIRSIDSGSDLLSPAPNIPERKTRIKSYRTTTPNPVP